MNTTNTETFFIAKRLQYFNIAKLNSLIERLENDNEKDNTDLIQLKLAKKELKKKVKYSKLSQEEKDIIKNKNKGFSIDYKFGKQQEPLVLSKIKENLKINNIYSRGKQMAIFDYYIGEEGKEDIEDTSEYDLEVKSRKGGYYWGKYNSWIFGENKFNFVIKRIREGKVKRGFVLFNMKRNKDSKEDDRVIKYWEIKDNEEWCKKGIKKISNDIWNKARNDPQPNSNNIEVWAKECKDISELYKDIYGGKRTYIKDNKHKSVKNLTEYKMIKTKINCCNYSCDKSKNNINDYYDKIRHHHKNFLEKHNLIINYSGNITNINE